MWKRGELSGGGKYKYDAVTVSNSGTPIPLDFKPKYIVVMFQYQSGSTWYQCVCLYNRDYAPNKMSQMYDNTGGEYTLPQTSRNGISDVTDNSFTLYFSSSLQIRLAYYLAVGD